jgi:hypothetical protein
MIISSITKKIIFWQTNVSDFDSNRLSIEIMIHPYQYLAFILF